MREAGWVCGFPDVKIVTWVPASGEVRDLNLKATDRTAIPCLALGDAEQCEPLRWRISP
jgi:hypothetical protein